MCAERRQERSEAWRCLPMPFLQLLEVCLNSNRVSRPHKKQDKMVSESGCDFHRNPAMTRMISAFMNTNRGPPCRGTGANEATGPLRELSGPGTYKVQGRGCLGWRVRGARQHSPPRRQEDQKLRTQQKQVGFVSGRPGRAWAAAAEPDFWAVLLSKPEALRGKPCALSVGLAGPPPRRSPSHHGRCHLRFLFRVFLTNRGCGILILRLKLFHDYILPSLPTIKW